ncbi:MAG: mechanosensitive ion channel [Bacilli bacterium]|nr:mechanosensitive ion channel [Bacilli bacterium]
MTWESFWQSVVNYFTANAWNFLIFGATLVAGLILIWVTLVVIKRIMRIRRVDEMAIRFVAAVLRFLLLILLVLILLSIIGVPINGITTTFSAAVLAVGMALKDFLSNVASGIILVGSRKYKTGDYVQVADVEGSIVDINFLFTTLKTPNSTQVTLPNSTMVNSPVTNLGAYPSRRIAITFTVAYESDTQLVTKTLLSVMKSCPLVYDDPEPTCHLKELGESSIDFFCTCFCDNADYWNAYFYIMDHGFEECKRVGIVFPFKQIELTNKAPVEKLPLAYPNGLQYEPKKRRKKSTGKLTVDEMEDLSFLEMVVRFREQAKAERAANKAAAEKRKADRQKQLEQLKKKREKSPQKADQNKKKK